MLTIEYTYFANHSSKSFSSLETIIRHKIPKKVIKEYINDHKKDTSLLKEDIIELLYFDGANIIADRIRYYDPSEGAFIKLTEEFSLDEFSKEHQNLLLWVEKAVSRSNRRMNMVLRRLRRLERTYSQSQVTSSKHIETPNNLEKPFSLRLKSTEETIAQSMRLESPLLKKFSTALGDSAVIKKTLFRRSSNQTISQIFESEKKLDIAIMYAEPLIQLQKSNITVSLPDAVDYEEECRIIYEILQDTGSQIELMIEIATRTNLVMVLSKNPTILHLLCHGEFDSERKQFYLCLEKPTGELDPLYSDDLKEILDKFNTKVQLVFVNACHSEPVARVFADAGVPCVVAVQSQSLITDMFAKKFSREFYRFIHDNKTVKEAFDFAVIASKDPAACSCCCGHSHKSNCLWVKKARQEGYSKLHQNHIPVCTTCPNRGESVHLLECEWAQSFIEEFCPNREIDFEKHAVNTCCCSPELPHNELLKFVLISKDEYLLEHSGFFKDLEDGKVHNQKSYSIIDQRFPERRLLGRNKQLYELSKLLLGPTKIVKLVGSCGIGKTALSRQLANYLYARNHFRYKISVVDLSRVNSIAVFLSKIFKEIEFITDLNGFCELMRVKEALYIIENMNTFIEQNKTQLKGILKEITQNTKHVKFLLVMDHKIDLELNEGMIKLDPLYPEDAARLLLLYTPLEKILPRELRNLENLKSIELFKKYSDRISPLMLWRINQKVIQEKVPNLLKIQAELIKEFGASKSEELDEQSILNTLTDIKLQNPEGYQLLIKISSFYSGLSYLDLEELSNLGLIATEWKKILGAFMGPSIQQSTVIETSSEATKPAKKRSRTREPMFKPGYYFWLTIANQKKGNELIFRPVVEVRNVIFKKPDLELMDAFVMQMEYLAIFATSLLSKVKKVRGYSENLIENSAVCDHGIWRVSPKNAFNNKLKIHGTTISYLQYESMSSWEELSEFFSLHSNNFKECFNISILKRIIAEEDLKTKLLELIEILWIAIPTLFGIFGHVASETPINMASRALNTLKGLPFKNEIICLTKIKLHLFLVAYTLLHNHDYTETQTTLNNEFELIEEAKSEITSEEILARVNFEVAFAKAKLLYSVKKGHYKDTEKSDEGPQKFNQILGFLENICSSLLKKIDSDTEFDHARVKLLACRCQIYLKDKNLSTLSRKRLKKPF